MKKMFLSFWVLLAAINSITFVQKLQGQEQELPRLAVVEFTSNVNTEKTQADGLTVRNLVESQMVAVGKYQIITRSEIDQLLNNQRIQVSSISSAENIKKLQLQNISYIVTGSVDAMGSDYAVTVKILDVSTGQFSHSANEFMGGGSRELYNGVNTLVANFVKGMSAEGGQVAQAGSQRPRSGVSAAGIGIEVSTVFGGTLYFQGEEIATLWDNDTYTIPIERPGLYKIRMVFASGRATSRDVTITSRGVVKERFLSPPSVGDRGPGGGIVFFAEGETTMEVSGLLGKASWNEALNLARNYRGGGYSDWHLPTRNELDLVYKNLRARNIGNLGNDWHWSSSESSNNYAWTQNFSDGSQYNNYDYKHNTYSVRAVRAF
jgi:TolB-like protein